MPQRYGDLFWESLSQRPSPTWTEEWHIPPSPRATGCSQPGLYPLERLPPPEVLCRRKRRRPHLAGMQQGPAGIPAQVRAVTYHLEDLRRRQRIINELKKAQWDVSGAAPEPLAPATAGCGVPSATEYPGLEEARATYPQEEGHPVTTGRTQLLWSPWSPLGLGGVWCPQTTGLSGLLQRCPSGQEPPPLPLGHGGAVCGPLPATSPRSALGANSPLGRPCQAIPQGSARPIALPPPPTARPRWLALCSLLCSGIKKQAR
ncbi:protein INCA1 isoform X2 [Herpailurus yagouaroundi]|uniref:protein INCA1 isoform X2 n=1 Tax=Herpailurus yagouaroundi TaxID=1608482 RepID=UPI001AD77C32|nr:protein INCA1 isoform X2 [Puma yagouaroundi]